MTEAGGAFTLSAVSPRRPTRGARPTRTDAGGGHAQLQPVSQAALILAVQTLKAPEAPYGVAAVFDTGGLRVAAEHPTYQQMLLGERLAFGVG